jgi:hypothetical protein
VRVIQKLEPPLDVKQKMRQEGEDKLPKNWLFRFIKIFFMGDGY